MMRAGGRIGLIIRRLAAARLSRGFEPLGIDERTDTSEEIIKSCII